MASNDGVHFFCASHVSQVCRILLFIVSCCTSPSALTTSAPPNPPQVADRLLECGTTASVVLVQGDTCALANAGDTTAVLGR